ncbi:MAG: radical domain iron-sulfur cluster-binding oxidoreductase with cobalamin-binding-like domain [Deltaproteobacteria bacterium]|nr:radical domain iron-sulfur cluster-binding oxidoreductase with cobalamin-binding-like domain [Deltaproteobacteria bacterium]
MSHLPANMQESLQRGWHELDVVFVTGDAYIDHPAFGVPLLARWLEHHGFRVGIIAQPDWQNIDSFRTLGRPKLFFAVTAGAMDSMVAHYTPAGKLRHDDAYTPGNRHGARPNRATIVYTSCCKAAYRDVPVVIGGIEASLRRFSHYDYWGDKVRRSILFDSKAELLVYGMGERSLLAIAQRLKNGEDYKSVTDVCGTAVAARPGQIDSLYVEIPSYQEVVADRKKYAEAFRLVAHEQNPYCGRAILQGHGDRALLCNPPAMPLTSEELDLLYSLEFTRLPHPSYQEPIAAWEQIKSSITTHRGCSGGCSFCAITHHQGKFIQSRSERSVLHEIERVAAQKWCRGSISDIGGPTANMFGMKCTAPDRGESCRRDSCLYPSICRNLYLADKESLNLLRKARNLPAVRHTAVASGVRFDLLLRQPGYFAELVANHVGGLLKVAPEHLCENVVRIMHKPGERVFAVFLEMFRRMSREAGKRQGVVPYLISGHPGCTINDMVDLALKLKEFGLRVEQVQDFTPTPGTLSTCIYYSGIDPFSGESVHVPRGAKEKRLQKALLLAHLPESRNDVLEALRVCNREADGGVVFGNGAEQGESRNGKQTGRGKSAHSVRSRR